MQAAAIAIEYIVEHTQGDVLVFVDNQSTLKSLFNVMPHSLFELSRNNNSELGHWLAISPQNMIKFRWMPSHLGFHINELADKVAGSPPIGPFPAPHMTIASRVRDNKASIVHKWRHVWQTFAANKELRLKKKKKQILPNAWDGKSKFFMWLTQDMTQYSWFTRLVSGHAPTGEF